MTVARRMTDSGLTCVREGDSGYGTVPFLFQTSIPSLARESALP